MRTSIKHILRKWENSLERFNKIDKWSFNYNLSKLSQYVRDKEDDRYLVNIVRQIRDNAISPFFNPEEVLRLIKLVFTHLELKECGKIQKPKKSSRLRQKRNGQEVIFRGETNKIFEEKLRFKNGMLLRNFDVETANAIDSRKVRRIVEKRMCQAYHKMHHLDYKKELSSNRDRYWEKRATSFQLYNIGQIEDFRGVSRGKSTHWKKMYDPLTGEVVLKKKMAYPNRETALAAIDKWKVDNPYDTREMHAYECCVCHKWHIGHFSDCGEASFKSQDSFNLPIYKAC